MLPVPIIDTREQRPYLFSGLYFQEPIARCLASGDYSVEGLEDILSIERKMTVNEIAKNMTESRYKDWTGRLAEIKYPFIVCEFSYADVMGYPHNAKLKPSIKRRLKTNGAFILSRFTDLMIEKRIHVIFAGSQKHAEFITASIMRKVFKNES